MGTTATGTAGANTIAVGSAAGLQVGMRVQLDTNTSQLASVNATSNIYTITEINGTTITLDDTLSQTYGGVTLYGGYVSQLADKSGQGNSVTQNTSANMPLWMSNGQNNLGTARYDGTDYFELPYAAALNGANVSVFAVAASWGGTGYRAILASRSNFTGYTIYAGSAGTWQAWTGSGSEWEIAFGSTIVTSQPEMFSAIMGGGFSTFYQNGVDRGSVAYAVQSGGPFRLGAGRTEQVSADYFFNGTIPEALIFSTTLSTNAQALVNQYQSAKWSIALSGPGVIGSEVGLTGTEAQKAMASVQEGATTDGYSVFAASYLNRLSQSSDIILQASNNINLDLQGATLTLAAGRNITLTAGNQILTASTGGISTSQSSGSGGNIAFSATNGIVFNNTFALNSGGGNINLNNAVTLNSDLTANAGSGTLSFGSTVNGANNLTANAGTFSFGGAIGGATALNAVSLTSTNATVLPAINAGSLSVQTSGAAADISTSGVINIFGSGALTFSAYRDINIANAVTLNGGVLALRTNNADVGAGAINIGANLTTNGGNITIGGGSGAISAGSGYAIGDAQYANGVLVNAAISSGAGNIIINGRGYGIAGAANSNGIYQVGTIQSTSGTITLSGIGGTNSGSNVNGGAILRSTITSAYGNISITGIGGAGGTSFGIWNWGNIVSSTGIGAGAATITETGTTNFWSAVALNAGTITSKDGAISISGTSASAPGIDFYNTTSSIISTGSASIVLNAHGNGTLADIEFGSNAVGNQTYTIGGASATGAITINATSSNKMYVGMGTTYANNLVVRTTNTVTFNGKVDNKVANALSSVNVTAGAMVFNGAWGSTTSLTSVSLTSASSLTLPALSAASISAQTTGAGADLFTGETITTIGTGAVTLSAFRDIHTTNGISLGGGALTLRSNNTGDAAGGAVSVQSSIATNGGSITIGGGSGVIAAGSGYAVGDAQYGDGVRISGVVSSGAGDIIINGKGRDNATGTYIYGVYAGNTIQSTSGNIILNGIGQGGTGHGYMGVLLGATLTTASGSINIIGTGGNGANGINFGIWLCNGTVFSTGTGTISLYGTGGGLGNGNSGIGGYNSAGISSVDGAVTLTGIGGVGTSRGIDFYGTSNNILVSGIAPISLTGIGAGGAHDLYVSASGTTTLGGDQATGAITLIGNTLYFATGKVNVKNTSSGTITLKPRTASTSIGINGGTGSLGVTSAILSSLNPGAGLIIGDSALGTGVVTINGWDLRGKTYDVSVYGGPITFASNAVLWNNSQDLFFSATGTNALDINIGQAFTYSGTGVSNLTFKAGQSVITSSANITASSGTLNVIEWANASNTGAGSIQLTSSTITTNGGNVTLAGGADDGANGGTAGDGVPDNYAWGYGISDMRYGAVLFNSGIISGIGNITIRGHGYSNDPERSYVNGVYFYNSGYLRTTSGAISMTGIGGNATSYTQGIYINGANIDITTTTGTIDLMGTAGASSAEDHASGIQISSAEIVSTGIGENVGTITINGIGNQGAFGVMLAYGVDEIIASADGDIDILATNTSSSSGFCSYQGSRILTTGVGSINITASSVGGTGLALGNNVGYNDSILAVGTGDIILNADKIGIGAGGAGSFSVQTNGTLTLRPITALTTVRIGSGTGSLPITDTLMAGFSAGSYVFGSTEAGSIDINTAKDFGNADVTFISGGSINLGGTLSRTLGEDIVDYRFLAYGDIYNTNSAGIFATSGSINLTLQSDYDDGSAGAIYLSGGTISTNGGNVTIGGGPGTIVAGSGYAVGDAAHAQGITISNSISAGSGNVILNGRGFDTTTNDNHGVYFSGGTVSVSGSGTISVSGIGAGTSNSGNDKGIYFVNGSLLSAIEGAITLVGHGGGGGGTGISNVGIRIEGLSRIATSGLGNIFLEGTGGNNGGSGGSNVGVSIGTSNAIMATGSGMISVSGVGGNGSGTENRGITFSGAGTITGNNGDIILSGTGGGTGGSGHGFVIDSATAFVKTTGSGDIIITGISNGVGGSQHVYSNVANSLITLGSGAIIVKGPRINLPYSNAITTTGTGNITLLTNQFDLVAGSVVSAGSLTFAPYTNIAMSVGADFSGSFNLSDTKLGYSSAQSYIFGAATTGDGSISVADIIINTTHDFGSSNVSFVSGSSINLAGALTKSSGNAATYLFQADDEIYNTNSAGISALTGSIDITLQSNHDDDGGAIYLSSGTISSNGGNITIGGGSETISAGSGFALGDLSFVNGVTIANTINVGSGQLIVNGYGQLASTDSNYGISINGGTVSATGVGSIYLTGVGGGNTNSASNYGVYVNGAVSSINGDLTVVAQGGGAGSGGSNYGIGFGLSGSTLKTTGEGNIWISATGGDAGGTGTMNYGLSLNYISYALRATGSGGITITATGGNSSGSENRGLTRGNTVSIESNDGDITITAVGGGTGSGSHGFINGGVRTTGAGDITIIGNNADSLSYGIYVSGANGIYASGSGAVTLKGKRMNFASSNALKTTSGDVDLYSNYLTLVSGGISSAGSLSTAPYTAVSMGVGSGAGGSLNVSDALLGYMSASSFFFGSLTNGDGSASINDLTINTGYSFGASDVTFISGGNVKLFNTLATSGGNIAFNSPVVLGTSCVISAGSGIVTFSSTLNGGHNFTATAGTFSFAGAVGGTTPLGPVSLVSENSLSLPAMTAVGLSVQTTGPSKDISTTGEILMAENVEATVTGNIRITNAINGSVGNPVNVILSAGGYIYDTASINTYGGDLVMRSNHADVATTNTTYSAIDIANATLQTGGGDLILGGGSASDENGNPTGYAYSSGRRGVYINNSTLNGNGGNISILGWASSSYSSVKINNSTVSSSGIGSVTIQGLQSGANSVGLSIAGSTISTASGFINLAGTGNSASGGGLGFEGGNGNIYSLSGNITLTGTGNSGARGLWFTSGYTYKIYSTSGDISLIADASGTADFIQDGTQYIGTDGSGTTTEGDILIRAMGLGGFTLPASTTIAVSGDGNITLDAGTGAFVNTNGASALTVGTGRWLVYSADPSGDAFGGLNSNNTAIWNAAYGDAISQTGNRYVFAHQPTLTVTSTNDTKTYGDDAAAQIADDYEVSGYSSGVANAFSGDTAATALAGSPLLASAGTAVSANIGTYAIEVAQGGLSSLSGYAFSFSNAGVLTVQKRVLTVIADDRRFIAGTPNIIYTGHHNLMAQDVPLIVWTYATHGYTGLPGSYRVTAIANDPLGRLANYTLTNVSGMLIAMPLPDTVMANMQGLGVERDPPLGAGMREEHSPPVESTGISRDAKGGKSGFGTGTTIEIEISPALGQQLGFMPRLF
jgi:hypothetical protein